MSIDLSIILLSGSSNDLANMHHTLGPVFDALQERSVVFETVVVGPGSSVDVASQIPETDGVHAIRARDREDNVLAQWKLGAAESLGDILWLIGPDAPVDVDRALAQLAVLQRSCDLVPGPDQIVIRRRALGALDTQVIDHSARGAVEALIVEALRSGRKIRIAPEHNRDAKLQPLSTGKTYSRPWTRAMIYEDTPGGVIVGRYSAAGEGTVFRQCSPQSPIIVGNFTSIAAGVLISNPSYGVQPSDRITPFGLKPTFGHNLDRPATTCMYEFLPHLGPLYAASTRPSPLVIGSDVWVASRATIIGGVTVGDGAMVSAGAVVLDNVPPFAIVAGNPAVVTRMRFSAAIIESLLRIRWWDWPDELIAQRGEWLTRSIEEFVDRFDSERRLGIDVVGRSPAGPVADKVGSALPG